MRSDSGRNRHWHPVWEMESIAFTTARRNAAQTLTQADFDAITLRVAATI